MQFVTMFLVGIIIAFVYDWKLTLVICSTFPVLVISGVLFNTLLVQGSTQNASLYAVAGSIADEALTLIRSVVAFGTQDHETSR